MQDLFDEIASPPEPEAPGIEDASAEESRVLAENPVEGGSEAAIEEMAGVSGENLEAPKTIEAAKPTAAAPEKETPKALPKQVNVVEEDPYDFEKCLVSIGIGLLPDDGHPDGRPVMLGIRNHQDEPLIRMCRLNDLMPLPDRVQQLLDQLKDELPARSERAAAKKKKAEAARCKSKTAIQKTAPPLQAKKVEKPRPASMNLFDMFDLNPK
jgi:hypothetical protein